MILHNIRFFSRSKAKDYKMVVPRGDREQPDPNNCLGVFGLNLKTTDDDLDYAFGKFGPLDKVVLVLDGPAGKT